MWRAGVCTLMACAVTSSDQTSIVPKTTCRPSKKLSPTIITVEPPDVQPSLGEMALMHGVAVKGTEVFHVKLSIAHTESCFAVEF